MVSPRTPRPPRSARRLLAAASAGALLFTGVAAHATDNLNPSRVLGLSFAPAIGFPDGWIDGGSWAYPYIAPDGAIIATETGPILAALDRGLIPLVFGDVAFDQTQGATIVSTEEVLAALVPVLRPTHLTLAGMVDGVFDADPARQPDAHPLPRLSAAQIDDLAAAFGGSHGIDVTGGMAAKLRTMAALLAGHPDLHIHLLSGEIPGQLQRHLIDPDLPLGTLLTAG